MHGSTAWQSYPMGSTLPRDLGEAMCTRAERFGVAQGGRFEVRRGGVTVLIVLWSPERDPTGQPREPVGGIWLRWAGSDEAVIDRVACDPARDDAFEQLQQAIEILAGEPLP